MDFIGYMHSSNLQIVDMYILLTENLLISTYPQIEFLHIKNSYVSATKYCEKMYLNIDMLVLIYDSLCIGYI